MATQENPVDRLNHCIDHISLIETLLCLAPNGADLHMVKAGDLCTVLWRLRDELEGISNELSQPKKPQLCPVQ